MDAPILSSLGPEPWKAPWWKPAAGEGSVFLYVLTIHVLAVIGLIAYPLPGWRIVLISLAVAWVGGMGVTIAYHRSIAHGSLRLHPVLRHVFIFFAMFFCSGGPACWWSNHRQRYTAPKVEGGLPSPL